MQTEIVRHIVDVQRVDFDWVSGLQYYPPRPQESPEHIIADVTITLSNGQRLTSSLVFLSPKPEDEPVPLNSVSWLRNETTSAEDHYYSFSRFRRALMKEAARYTGTSQSNALQPSFQRSAPNSEINSELEVFYSSAFWRDQSSNPQLVKLSELGWCIFFKLAIWQALPGITSGFAITFLKSLDPHLGNEQPRELLKQLVVSSTINETFRSHSQPSGERVARKQIPENVRHEVWRRDQGRCVQCGRNEKLEFDHIVPYSRGGSDTARNVQLLCEACNRRKSATI